MEVDRNPDYYLRELQLSLQNRKYETSKYEVFIKDDGRKQREIYKLPYYPDRVCHWAIIQVAEPYFIKKLNHCTHSAIPGRGVHSALSQVDRYMRGDVEGTRYCLKIDIKKYYPSINHKKLKEMYRGIFKDPNLLWLIDEIVDSGGEEVGVPIGNYLSQHSGNLYLYKFDRWIKEDLGFRYYTRYMDDMVFFHRDKARLHELMVDLQSYLKTELDLQVKENWQIFPSRTRGVDFVGYRHFGDYILLRKSISKKMIRTMRNIQRAIDEGGSLSYSDYCSINGYKGWLKWCNGHNLYERWVKPIESYCDKYHEGVLADEDI